MIENTVNMTMQTSNESRTITYIEDATWEKKGRKPNVGDYPSMGIVVSSYTALFISLSSHSLQPCGSMTFAEDSGIVIVWQTWTGGANNKYERFYTSTPD